MTKEFAVLPGQHAIGNIGELGNPHHLRIRLGVLNRVQNKIKCLASTDAPGHSGALTSDHHGLQRNRRRFSTKDISRSRTVRMPLAPRLLEARESDNSPDSLSLFEPIGPAETPQHQDRAFDMPLGRAGPGHPYPIRIG